MQLGAYPGVEQVGLQPLQERLPPTQVQPLELDEEELEEEDVLPEEVVDDVPQTMFWKLFPVPLLL